MVLRHTHTERHRGLIPSDQLGVADGTAGWVLTDDGAGFAEWAAASAGGTGILVVDVATIASVDIAGGDLDGPTVSLDGIGGLGAGDRVLVKDGGPTAVENGIYELTAGAPIRATDSDTGAELEGSFVIVQQGDENANSLWHNTNLTTPTVGVSNITYASVGTLAQVLRAGNDTEGQVIHATDAGSSLGASLQLNIAVGADGGLGELKGGDASGGNTGGDALVYNATSVKGGNIEAYGGNGISGKAGGDVKLYGGTGHAGAGDIAGIELGGGSAAGAAGKVQIYSDGTNGTATYILTSDGTYATWQAPPSGTFTPAADPGDIADPTMATAEDVALKLNALMAAMRTAGNLV